MNPGVALFIIIMTAMVIGSALLFAWMRTRAQAKLAGGGLEAQRQVELLSSENAGLKGQVGRLEERIAVLERIAPIPRSAPPPRSKTCATPAKGEST